MSGRDDGVERLRRWTDEARGVPPAFGRLRASFDAVVPARTTVRVPLTGELLLPDGRSTSGITALVADFGLTTSVISSLPDLRGVTTISMTVDHLGPPPRAGFLIATCRTAGYEDGRPQHASGTLHDDSGELVAQVSGWFLPTPAEAVSAERIGPVEEPAAGDLLDLLQIPAGPEFRLVTRDALSNAIGSLHGGIGALVCSLAAEAALPELRPLTSTFAYLRPTPRNGSVTARGSAVRQGRRTGAAEADLLGEDGRVLLSARVVTGSQV